MLVHAPRLQELFDRIVEVIIKAQEYNDLHPQESIENTSFTEHSGSDQLRIELNRVLHMEGGREIIEKAQEAALNRLDSFEKKRLQH